ncbi:CaiB/BaiF CoA-transferase family protein [Aurantimonas sp. VKM B-3413]|uniref:CaiB/BaiF CoA transferase family protein n=1 Tax=Aurantimonas sp. VKM B-3413 TaxID=2779401 RepID=UPI001E4BEF57|nr:CoA transferase [Aurantimonas sp. VKM B-3413]MCB8838071.1 CoA transferase [Aurantimonas sp. VKM B-3413]
MSKSILAGIKVLDLSRFIAGPHCAMILGDMGADVIKIEKAGVGDDSRHLPPFQGGESFYMLALNRNKRSITMNFRSPEAQEMLREMAAKADVVIENFRPGTMEAMGCGWEVLHEINPRLVMTRLSGFGQDGPGAMRPGFDGIAQAMSGLMSLTGDPEGPPMLAGTFYIDYMTAMYAATATLGALLSRRDSGEGQMVDVSLLESATALLTTALGSQTHRNETLHRMGNRDRYSAPANVFRTASDDHVLMLSGTNGLFKRLCGMMERPDLLEDERFSSVHQRMENVEAIEAEVAAWFGARDTETVLARLEEAGLPHAKVATPADVIDNPQLRHRNQILEIEHPKAGRFTTPGLTMHLSQTPPSVRRHPPSLGEHTDEVLAEWFGYDADRIARLRGDGVV